jgi:AraC-like DNA-binding protein
MSESEKKQTYFREEFLREELSKNEDFKTVSGVFGLLADFSRLKIYWLLCHSKECVSSIAEMMNMSAPAVAHHLKILKDTELIENYRDGKEVYYAMAMNPKSKALHEIIEQLMSMECPDFAADHEEVNENSAYMENQVETVKKVHDYLTENLSQRFTIDELAKQFAMNSTTLKTVFKDVYGTSLAAHIKEHRMKKAAEILMNSDSSINQISLEVGYESQSKFSATFKDYYGVSPLEYKRNNSK